MRIIDWSSDVCSSDFDGRAPPHPPPRRRAALAPATRPRRPHPLDRALSRADLARLRPPQPAPHPRRRRGKRGTPPPPPRRLAPADDPDARTRHLRDAGRPAGQYPAGLAAGALVRGAILACP